MRGHMGNLPDAFVKSMKELLGGEYAQYAGSFAESRSEERRVGKECL